MSRDCIINQGLSHHPRKDPDKMTAILPDQILFSNQTKESFVHKRGSLKGVSRPFTPQKGLSQAP
jgi:hypothetical protein